MVSALTHFVSRVTFKPSCPQSIERGGCPFEVPYVELGDQANDRVVYVLDNVLIKAIIPVVDISLNQHDFGLWVGC